MRKGTHLMWRQTMSALNAWTNWCMSGTLGTVRIQSYSIRGLPIAMFKTRSCSNFPLQFDLVRKLPKIQNPPTSSWIWRIRWYPWFNDFSRQKEHWLQRRIFYMYIIYQLQYTKSSYCGWFSDQPTVAMEDDARMHCARNVSLKPGFNLALLDGHVCSLLERTAVNKAPDNMILQQTTPRLF